MNEEPIDLDKDWLEEEWRREVGEETEVGDVMHGSRVLGGDDIRIPEVEIPPKGWAKRIMKWVIYG